MQDLTRNKKAPGADHAEGSIGDTLSNINPEHAFRKAMSDHSLPYDGPLIADGRLHRFDVEGDKPGSKAGWYVLHNSGTYAGGAAGSWKTQEKFTWHERGSTMSQDDIDAMEARIEAAKLEADEARAEKRRKAAETASGLWDQATAAPAAGGHEYLKTKQVGAHGLKLQGENLLVPGFNVSGEIQTVQTITPDGTKRFLKGGSVEGAFHMIGTPREGTTLYLAEGYATGATLFENTGKPVAVAFNCGNLKNVAEDLAEEYPGAKLVVACDNDSNTEGNPGLTKGIEAAAAVEAPYVVPTFNTNGSDFNDLHVNEGGARLSQCLSEQLPSVWPDLSKTTLSPLPEFPWDSMPGVLKDQAQQVASTYQVPAEFPAMATLTVAGASMGNRTRVQLKKGVSVRPNLYTFVAMSSGERKSSAYRPVTEPLDQYAADHAEEWATIQRERRIHKSKVDYFEKRLSKPLSSQDENKAREGLEQLEEPPGTCKDFLAENSTEEALQTKLAECGERACVFSADSRDVLQVLTGIYTNGQNKETTFLKAFDGDSLRVHRMGRTLHLEHPSISMLLCVQKDKLAEIGNNEGLWAGGFIPRLIFLVPDSGVGSRLWAEEALNPDIQLAYNREVFKRLDWYADQKETCLFPLDDSAKARWIEFYNALEEDMGDELANHAPSGARWQTLPVRLSAIIAEYSGHSSISDLDMKKALNLAGYLIQHQRRAAGLMNKGMSSDLERVVKHIRVKKLTKFKPSEISRVMNAKAAKMSEWLTELEALGYVRPTGELEGHKKVPVYAANPGIWRVR